MAKMSLRYLSAKQAASSLDLTKADLIRVPVDVYDDLRRHVSKEKQIELWDGEYKEWWPNGQLRKHCWYKNGATSQQRGCTGTPPNGECSKRDGEYKWWYRNGQLAVHCWYKHGLRDGEYKWWYCSGLLRVHCWYKNGTISYIVFLLKVCTVTGGRR
jgi:hypothetical protein